MKKSIGNRPTTIDGMAKSINKHVQIYNYVIRKIWYCNAGWGIQYIKFGQSNLNEGVTHAYYPTIEACFKGEYKRCVLLQKERGGFYLWDLENNKPISKFN